MSKIRMVLIGCGGMAKAHASRFGYVTDRVQVVAAVDVIPERAKAVAELIPGCRAATDYKDVMGYCEATLIALPHHLHHPVGMDFLKAGKHVFMEKPLANTEAECLELIHTARQVKKTLMVGYVQRYHPLVNKMKELIDAGKYGKLFQLSLWTEQYSPIDPNGWCGRRETLGGGQLFSHGCHYIDLLLWFLGRPLEGTHIGTNLAAPWMDREATSHVAIRFESGALGYHFGTWNAKGTRLGYAIHAHCEGGMIELNFRKGRLTGIVGENEENLLTAEEEKHHMIGKPTELELRHFLDCVETGALPKTDGPTSLQGLRVIWRTYDAEDRHTVADLRGLGFDQVDCEGNLKSCS